MEVDPGPLLDLIKGPSHEIRLPAVRDIENKTALLGLPTDGCPACRIERDDPDPVSFPANRYLVSLDVLPFEVQALGFSEACMDGEFDDVWEDSLQLRSWILGDLPGGLEDLLDLGMAQSLDFSFFLEKFDLPNGIRAPVDFPIDRFIEHPAVELQIPVDRSLGRRPQLLGIRREAGLG
jgi:hypothetical protein